MLPVVWNVLLWKTIHVFLWLHFLWCEVFVLLLFWKDFLLGHLRACFGFATLRATLACVRCCQKSPYNLHTWWSSGSHGWARWKGYDRGYLKFKVNRVKLKMFHFFHHVTKTHSDNIIRTIKGVFWKRGSYNPGYMLVTKLRKDASLSCLPFAVKKCMNIDITSSCCKILCSLFLLGMLLFEVIVFYYDMIYWNLFEQRICKIHVRHIISYDEVINVTKTFLVQM